MIDNKIIGWLRMPKINKNAHFLSVRFLRCKIYLKHIVGTKSHSGILNGIGDLCVCFRFSNKFIFCV